MNCYFVQKYGLGNDIRYTSEWANFPFNDTSLTRFWHEATFTLNESIVQAGLYKQQTSRYFFEIYTHLKPVVCICIDVDI